MRAIAVIAVPGMPEVTSGDDLGALIASACRTAGIVLRDDDVLAVASKVVAKAEGRCMPASSRDDAVAAQTVREVAARTMPGGRVTRVVQSRSGPVLAAAGVDASDVAAGTVLLLPADPDASARSLRAGVAEAAGVRPAVVVTDTAGRPWRNGVSDFALGAAGLVPLDDARGTLDRFGRPLEVTVRAVADELAAAADLVKGKAVGTPVAVVRGLGPYVTDGDGPGAAGCVRVGPTDWFTHGQVEAVWAALGLEPGDVAPPPLDPMSETPADRVARAVAVASAGRTPSGVSVSVDGDRLVLQGSPVDAGRMAERLATALWAEGLGVKVGDDPAGPVILTVEAQ